VSRTLVRRWVGAVALLLAVAVTGGGAVWAQGGTPALDIQKVDAARFAPGPNQPVFFLAVGVDGRPGLEGNRGDALHLIGVNPAVGSATILNIPRDTAVNIPGHGTQKINNGSQFGGPALQAAAVRNLTGVQAQFVLTSRFEGLRGMVDELGGVPVNVPFAMNDKASGARFPAGVRHMHGAEALAFSRNRHIPGGDVRRSEHQGVLMIATLARLRALGTTPAAVVRYVSVLARHVHIHGVSLGDLYRLGRLGLSLDPARVRNVTMPSIISGSFVYPAGGAPSLFADFRDDAVLQAH
jgi:LCP family protein required for cell wall assembly